ncbi:hypothetical protein PproGo58_24950 [Pseudomonas protegens]|nr:hypothetical protein PproGo58_24950 [Pseudomonas protegens]
MAVTAATDMYPELAVRASDFGKAGMPVQLKITKGFLPLHPVPRSGLLKGEQSQSLNPHPFNQNPQTPCKTLNAA